MSGDLARRRCSSANSIDMTPGPVRGLPLDLSLFPIMESIDIVDRDWRRKTVEANTYGFSDSYGDELGWCHGVYGQDTICLDG